MAGTSPAMTNVRFWRNEPERCSEWPFGGTNPRWCRPAESGLTNPFGAETTIVMTLDRRFTIAPMMEWTDRHCRFFHRLLTRRALIYTEMVTTGAVLRGDRARLLAYDAAEHPVAL